MYSSVQPLNKSKRPGDWRESQTRPAVVTGTRRSEKQIPVFGKHPAEDTSSFSDMLQSAIKKTAKPEDDLTALMHIMSGGNDRIRTMARGLTAPIPQTDALMDVAIARARVVPYGNL